MLIVRSLYGLKSRGASWRAMLAEIVGKDGIGCISTSKDNYVWIMREVLPYRKDYYSIILVYVDDIFYIHKDTSVVVDALASINVMKQGRMGPPDRYLGDNTKKVQTQEGNVMWATNRGDYCKSEIENPEKTLTDDGKSLLQYGYVRRPYPSSFPPDIDTTAELDENGVHEYQHHIGMLREAI